MGPNFFKKPQESSEINPQATERKAGPELPPRLERLGAKESQETQAQATVEAEQKQKPASLASTSLPQMATAPVLEAKSELRQKVENILEQDLQDVYFKMEPAVQKKFKFQGEVTAKKIEAVLAGTKIKANEIFKLLVEWLKVIPGVNKFFIRQAAKIKTNKILDLKK